MSNGNSHCSLNLLLRDLSPSLTPLYSFLLKGPPPVPSLSAQSLHVLEGQLHTSLPKGASSTRPLLPAHDLSPHRAITSLLSISSCLTACSTVYPLSSFPLHDGSCMGVRARSLSLPPGPGTAKKHGMSCTNGPFSLGHLTPTARTELLGSKFEQETSKHQMSSPTVSLLGLGTSLKWPCQNWFSLAEAMTRLGV